MKARKFVFVMSILMTVILLKTFGQDYFSDRNGNGTPILLKDTSGRLAKQLFSAGVNLTDKTSIKANLFSQYNIGKNSYLGWGISASGSTNNNAVSLFNSGDFSPGFSGGGYISLTRLVEGDNSYYSYAVILSGTLAYTTYQFFDPSLAYNKQLSSVNFAGNMAAISTVFKLHLGGVNLFTGLSLSVGHQSNYSSLKTVTIKNDSLITGSGVTRTVEQINKNGDTYAMGKFIQYTDYNLRYNATYIPPVFKYKMGFTLYPSTDFCSSYLPRYNVGLALSLLKDKNPSTSIASIYFEADDIGNAMNINKPFINRAFKVGISTTLNVVNGSK